jgi:hypothetical protein
MPRKVTAHVTLRGAPLCCAPGPFGLGTWGQCEHKSVAAARRMVKRLQRQDWGFRVVRGPCPVKGDTEAWWSDDNAERRRAARADLKSWSDPLALNP